MEHDVDAVVCGVGSGGTLAGLSRFFARVSPQTEMVLADPVGSVLCDYIKTGKFGRAGKLGGGRHRRGLHSVDGRSVAREGGLLHQRCREPEHRARTAASEEGILGGSSSGTLVAAALRYCREQTKPKRVVTFICDTGNKYLSKMFNDYWMADQGFLKRDSYGDLRDIISRRADERAVVSIEPEDTLMTAYARMKLYDISQIPVMEGEQVIGLIDEWDLLLAVQDDPAQVPRAGAQRDDPAPGDGRRSRRRWHR